jgi:hypothetical protein
VAFVASSEYGDEFASISITGQVSELMALPGYRTFTLPFHTVFVPWPLCRPIFAYNIPSIKNWYSDECIIDEEDGTHDDERHAGTTCLQDTEATFLRARQFWSNFEHSTF